MASQTTGSPNTPSRNLRTSSGNPGTSSGNPSASSGNRQQPTPESMVTVTFQESPPRPEYFIYDHDGYGIRVNPHLAMPIYIIDPIPFTPNGFYVTRRNLYHLRTNNLVLRRHTIVGWNRVLGVHNWEVYTLGENDKATFYAVNPQALTYAGATIEEAVDYIMQNLDELAPDIEGMIERLDNAPSADIWR